MKTTHSFRYWIEYVAIRTILALLGLLPFRQRSALMAWVVSRIVAPLAGYRRRVRTNLTLVWPDMDPEERDRLTLAITRQIGRAFCELFSPKDLARLARQARFTGPGLEALIEARAAGRPAIIVSGHFGNYDIVRSGLLSRGFNIGALYRHMNNPYFHDFYLRNISTTGSLMFERGRPGLGAMVRHLKEGGVLAALFDVRANFGIQLPFLGHDAWTAVSMAELALRYDAILVPFYATRLPDGAEFVADFEKPIPHSDPETMTLALNRSLEARVRQDPDQWFWVHNRWKHKRG